MKVDLNGLFQNAIRPNIENMDYYKYCFDELLANLYELKERKGEGDVVIDKFFEYYSIKKPRLKYKD